MAFDMDLDSRLKRKLKLVEKDPELSKRNKEIILRYIRESSLGKTILKGQKKKINPGRNLQAIGYLLNMSKKWFKKDLDKVNDKEMEDFILALDDGIIKSNKDKPYTDESKSNIKKFIRKFYKWLIGDGLTFPPLVNWIDTSKQQADIQAIPGLEKGVQKMVSLIPDLRRKAIIDVLFDSGFRLGELINVRIADIEKRTDNIYYITCKFSKTKPRTVSLPLSSLSLARWLNEHPDNDNPQASVFLASRASIYKLCKNYGKKALKIHVHPHMLRHTSATYYATRISRTIFCKRFGWSYASQSPDRYIDFSKVEEEKLIEQVQSDTIQSFKKDMEHKLTEERIRNQELKDLFNESKKKEEKNTQELNALKKMVDFLIKQSGLPEEINSVEDIELMKTSLRS